MLKVVWILVWNWKRRERRRRSESISFFSVFALNYDLPLQTFQKGALRRSTRSKRSELIQMKRGRIQMWSKRPERNCGAGNEFDESLVSHLCRSHEDKHIHSLSCKCIYLLPGRKSSVNVTEIESVGLLCTCARFVHTLLGWLEREFTFNQRTICSNDRLMSFSSVLIAFLEIFLRCLYPGDGPGSRGQRSGALPARQPPGAVQHQRHGRDRDHGAAGQRGQGVNAFAFFFSFPAASMLDCDPRPPPSRWKVTIIWSSRPGTAQWTPGGPGWRCPSASWT